MTSNFAARSIARRGVLGLILSASVVSCGSAVATPSVSASVPVATSAPLTQGSDEVKTVATVVAVEGDRAWLRITDRNQNAQVTWNNRVVAVFVNAKTVFPGLDVGRLSDAHLATGSQVTLTFVPSQYDERLGAYPALVIGREQR